jgi:hypothetical protein
MVIFGAGASADSILHLATEQTAVGRRPPLARNLFDRAFERYLTDHPECGTLVDDLRTLGATTDLESTLERIQRDEAPRSALRRRQLLSLRYYLRDLLWQIGDEWQANAPGNTNYHKLFARLELWREAEKENIALVSFNYDRIVDKAVRDVFRMPLDSVDQYTDGSGVALFKPHGSVNWIRVVGDDRSLNEHMDPRAIEDALLAKASMDALEPEEEFHVISRRNAFWTPSNRVGIPALTIPALSKAAFECPRQHVASLTAAIPLVTKLLIVGWRATERHFLSLWKGTDARIHRRVQIVNRTQDSASVTLTALQEAGLGEAQYFPYYNGLSWYLGEPDQLDRFLTESYP